MPERPTQSTGESDELVSQYIADLRRRLPEYEREHDAELRQIGTDFVGRLFHEHILFGKRTDIESLLHSMLTPEECDRLQTDVAFTRAWQIFVDFYWLRKRSKRVALVIGCVLILIGLFWMAVWSGLFMVWGPQRQFLGDHR